MSESAVFVNQLRYEKIRDNQKKKATDNHRDNYTHYNKSNIFNPIKNVRISFIQNDSNNGEQPKGLQRTKTEKTFEPKYKQISARERKFNEFNVDKIGAKKDLNQILGAIKTQETAEETPRDKPREQMTAAERKLKTLHPDKTLAEIEKHRKTVVSELEEIPEKSKCNITSDVDDRAKSTKQKRVDNMYSNIFNDPKKKLDESVYLKQEELEEKSKEEKKVDMRPQPLKKTKTSAKLDWRTANTELIFKGDKDKSG